LSAVPDNFLQRIIQCHQALGIADSYREKCKLPLCAEPSDLVDTELDYYQRPQKLTPSAHKAWLSMKLAAESEGVSLYLISAFRSIEYQHTLLEKKLADGRQLTEILTVNAAPGYSEHHTGRAVDISTKDCPALEIEFEKTQAFEWLARRAVDFGFVMSYPEGNQYGISYEPWHWCFQV
jgi:D-alanyl-D-alanine carboxypeptidase